MEGTTADKGRAGVPGVARMLFPSRSDATSDTPTPRKEWSARMGDRESGTVARGDEMSRSSVLRTCRPHTQT